MGNKLQTARWDTGQTLASHLLISFSNVPLPTPLGPQTTSGLYFAKSLDASVALAAAASAELTGAFALVWLDAAAELLTMSVRLLSAEHSLDAVLPAVVAADESDICSACINQSDFQQFSPAVANEQRCT